MLRLRTWLVMVVSEAIGYEMTTSHKVQPWRLILGAIMLGLMYIAGTSFNDISDEKIDKINLSSDPSRPLVTTSTTTTELKVLGFGAILLSFFCAIILGPWLICVWFGALMLSVVYSVSPFKISHRGILAALLLPMSYVTIPFLTGHLIVTNNFSHFGLQLMLAMYLMFVGRVLLKDFRDEKGDKKFGKLTFLVRHGQKQTCLLAIAMWLISDVVLFFTLLDNYSFLFWIIQLAILFALMGLINLSRVSNLSEKLNLVLFVSRSGNAFALMILTYIYLYNRGYIQLYRSILTLLVGVFILGIALQQRHINIRSVK